MINQQKIPQKGGFQFKTLKMITFITKFLYYTAAVFTVLMILAATL